MTKENSSLSLPDVYKKENRRRRRVILGAVILIVYCVFLGGAWLVVHSPLFRIRDVEISGNKSVSNEEILALIKRRILNDSFLERTFGAENILAWPESFSADDLKLVPELKGISIKKDYKKRSVAVAVEERRPFGVWCLAIQQVNADISAQAAADNSCWWFDDSGALFMKALQVEGNLITVVDDYSQKNIGLGSDILPVEFIPNMFSIFKVVSSSELSVKEIRLNDVGLQEIEVDTYGAPKLYFSLRFPADNTLAVIQSLKNQPGFDKLQYLDFRVENRAYYK